MNISIVLCTFNHARWVAEALDSILMQRTTHDWQVVAVDDASDDGTQDILRDYAARHPDRFDLRLQDVNSGDQGCGLFVDAISHAAGEFVALLDGDDYWTDPAKLQRQADLLAGDPGCVLTGHNCLVRNERIGAERLLYRRPPQGELSTADLLRWNMIPTGSIMFRNGVLDAWPAALRPLGFTDWPLQLLLSERGGVRMLPEAMSAYRIHAGGLWSANCTEQSGHAIPDTNDAGWCQIIGLWEALFDVLDARHHAQLERQIAEARARLDPRTALAS